MRMDKLPENMLQHFARSFKLIKLEFVCHIFALKALVKTQNMDILQYSEWYWLLLSVNMTHQLLRTVLYTIPRKFWFTKRCFQKISMVLNRISLEKLLAKVFIFCFSVLIFLLLVLPLIPDAPTYFMWIWSYNGRILCWIIFRGSQNYKKMCNKVKALDRTCLAKHWPKSICPSL